MVEACSIDFSWAAQVDRLLRKYDAGETVSPRGQETSELLHSTVEVDLRYPALVNPKRGISHDFMAAESRWIVTGDDRLSPLEPHAPSIGAFADVDPTLCKYTRSGKNQQEGSVVPSDGDGLELRGTRFYGAYGPRFVEEMPRVVRCLGEDTDTRQAWLTLWRTNPPPTRDVPCTIALGFTIRNGRLNCHAYMRSSDVWLGLPYDVFTFSVLTYRIGQEVAQLYGKHYGLGDLYLTAASSHLYGRDVEKARDALDYDGVPRCRPITATTGAAFDEAIEAINYRLGYYDIGTRPEWKFWELDDA